MSIEHAASFDVELVPSHLTQFGRNEWRDYDHTLLALGPKSEPWRSTEHNIQVHADGLATEFAPLSPCYDVASFLATYTTLKNFTERLINHRLMGVDFVDISHHKAFTERNAPYLYGLAHTMGCSADYDLHGKREVPDMVKQSPIKEVGFHVHADLHPKFHNDADAVRSIVEEFYQATRFLHTKWGAERPPWYRAPCVYRPKPYGFEYRSFGASLVEDASKLAMLAAITFDFMEDHFHTHGKEYYT